MLAGLLHACGHLGHVRFESVEAEDERWCGNLLLAEHPLIRANVDNDTLTSMSFPLRNFALGSATATAGVVGVLLAQAPPPGQNGEALFFGKAACGTCHQVNARGGVTGPDLSGAGRIAAEALRKKIIDPNAAPDAGGRGGPSSVVVRTKDGKEIRGVRRSEDSFSLMLADAAGAVRVIDKRTLADQRVEAKSLMPADYATRLSSTDNWPRLGQGRARGYPWSTHL
jgi:putative heme-binding domain-containing protein